MPGRCSIITWEESGITAVLCGGACTETAGTASGIGCGGGDTTTAAVVPVSTNSADGGEVTIASVFRTPSAGFSARARRRANAGTCFAPANDAPDMLKPCACLLPPARPAPETLFGCCWCCCDCIGGCLYKAEMLGGPAAAIAKVGAAKGEPPTTAAERVKAVVQRHQDPRSVLPVLQQLLLRLPPLLPQQHQ
ncbi:hypothetical protein Vretimale_7396 [Volvox reticuliferus]|uniref:Uncharacterized protein n=1 Tax=Volvox reticuliferus TaxID=1737510 RepID=A0A8J4C9B3_9CHLO|nr:hypothetical protein Vretifemale_7487 [Volvox reticuliferus]GIM02555.1 hypothetical protein Vretimale_7396 [Volvox reticuliferus]